MSWVEGGQAGPRAASSVIASLELEVGTDQWQSKEVFVRSALRPDFDFLVTF